MNFSDERAIDALCRLQVGWSGFVEGDNEDYAAAYKIITERVAKVRGTFREPTELERFRSALQSIAKNSCCDHCREAALVAQSALKTAQQSEGGE